MPSFDIVSEIDEVALRHAVDNANRELSTRFDFRGVEASIEQNGLAVTLKTESDFQVRQLEELFGKACLKLDDARHHRHIRVSRNTPR